MYYVYLIQHKTGRTYIGMTSDVTRRVRQHNGELKGGARSTARMGPGWKLVAFLAGFRTRSAACSWERIIKCRARGVLPRKAAMLSVSLGKCPPARRAGRKNYKVPAGIQLTCTAGLG